MPAHTKSSHVSTTKRLSPPTTLSAGASRVFKHLVAAVDASHFSPVDLPLLAQYAGAADLASHAQQMLDNHGAVVDGKVSPWVGVLEKASKSCVALSSKLRLNPLARFDRLVAGGNARQQHEVDHADDPEGLLAR
jgi:P27 family predicted phage terminase small subunit